MSAPSADKREEAKAKFTKYAAKFEGVEPITASEILKLRAEGQDVVLVDVREKEEQQVSMIEGAITQNEFEKKCTSETCQGTLVVPYCTMGYRSGKYAQALQEQGYPQVKNGEGVVLWTHDVGSGLVSSTSEEVKQVHVYGDAWDLAADGYKTKKKEGFFTKLALKVVGPFL